MQKRLVFYTVSFALFFAACAPSKECEEAPKTDCFCTQQYDPVCGCNKKTYGNACAAQCAGIANYTKGACRSASDLDGSWKLTLIRVGNTPQQTPGQLHIYLKLHNGALSGHGGCNHLNGQYTADQQAFTVPMVASTKIACLEASPWENKFLERLRASKTYRLEGDVLEVECGDLGGLVFERE